MDSDRWKQVDGLLQSALERPPEERDAFLRQACAGDEALEREVRSLLASQQAAGSFLDSPAIEVAARAIAREQNKDTPEAAVPLLARPSPTTASSRSWAGAEWAWFTRPRTPACTGSWPSSFCPMRSLKTRKL